MRVAPELMCLSCLAALLAAGCGKEPVPVKPAPPAAPTPASAPASTAPAQVPPEPAEVAWGEAVNGVQVGLRVIGGDEELRLRRTADLTRVLARFTGPKQGMPVVRALDEAAKTSELRYMEFFPKNLHEDVAGGRTLSEALTRGPGFLDKGFLEGVVAGEAAGDMPAVLARMAKQYEDRIRPRGSVLEGEPLALGILLRNLAKSDLSLIDAAHQGAWSFDLAPVSGGPTLRTVYACREERRSRPFGLPQSETVPILLSIDDCFVFRADGSAQTARSIPPGKYTITASYGHGPSCAGKAPCPYWHGKVSTGPVAIEIKAKASAIAWGAAVNGLQVGLKAARPAFAEGEPLAFTVHLRNVGDAAKGVSGIYFDDFFFRPVGGGITLRSRWLGPQAAPPIKPPPPLEAGRGLEFHATVGGEDWHFEDASQPRAEAVGKPVHFPPAGKYTVTVGSTPGRIPSGEVEIEVRAKAAPAVSEARAREIAIATIKKRYPTYADEVIRKDWKVHLLADGKHWEAVWSWDNGIRGHRSELQIDAESGAVEQFRDLPGD